VRGNILLYCQDFKEKLLSELDSLIEEGNNFFSIKWASHSRPPAPKDQIACNKWVYRSNNCISLLSFPKMNLYNLEKFDFNLRKPINYHKIFEEKLIKNLSNLETFRDIVEKNLLTEFYFQVFKVYNNDLLDQMKLFIKHKHFPIAAILGRIIIELTLKRLTEKHNLEIKGDETAGTLNGLLYREKKISHAKHDMVSSLLVIGNDAAHGRNLTINTKREFKEFVRNIENEILTLI